MALTSAVLIGLGDFFATLAARRGRVLAATLWIMITSAVLMTVIALWMGGAPTTSDYLYGAIAGLGGGGALLTLYAGYAKTSIGIVGPITAVISVVLPVSVGVAIGDEVGSLAVLGIVIGVIAVALVGWKPDTGGRHAASTAVIYGVGAGIGFGVMATMLGITSEEAGLLPTIPTRVVSALLLVSIAAARKLPMSPLRDAWRNIPMAAVCAASGILLFTLAAQQNLTISGLLLQMAYAVSALLAIIFLDERSTVTQRVGFSAAVLAIAFVTLG
jgi:drug/metabolite transporter (DMT)-like permease